EARARLRGFEGEARGRVVGGALWPGVDRRLGRGRIDDEPARRRSQVDVAERVLGSDPEDVEAVRELGGGLGRAAGRVVVQVHLALEGVAGLGGMERKGRGGIAYPPVGPGVDLSI